MAFSFGLGSDTMLNQFQRDATQFKLVDMASNIQKYDVQVGQASSYVDYTFRYLNRFMQQDQENDDHATFLSEYQALLRSRIQQMITDLTTALTHDLDVSMAQVRSIWNDPAATGSVRASGQGYSSDVEDAGGARMAFNFFSGFANQATPADPTGTLGLKSYAYYGIPTYDARWGAVNKVAIDTQADASFSAVNPVSNSTQSVLRATGTAVIQQSFPEDGLTEAVVDNLRIRHQGNAVTYNQVGGGFIDAKNTYKFINTSGNPFDTQNIFFYNASMANSGDTGNLNDDTWDGTVTRIDPYTQFNSVDNAKNTFEQKLYDTIYELDQRNLLRDIMRLSEKDGLLNDIQIASTTSIATGTQTSASIKLNFIPNETGPVTASDPATGKVTVASNADFFQVGDIVKLVIQASPEETVMRQITAIDTATNELTFGSPPNATLPAIIANSPVKTTREDLGGRIQVIMDHYTAFFHS